MERGIKSQLRQHFHAFLRSNKRSALQENGEAVCELPSKTEEASTLSTVHIQAFSTAGT